MRAAVVLLFMAPINLLAQRSAPEGTYFPVERFQHADCGRFFYGQRLAFVADWNSDSDHPANLALRWTSLAQ